MRCITTTTAAVDVDVVRYAHETEWDSTLVVRNIRATSGGEEEKKKKEENKTHRQ